MFNFCVHFQCLSPQNRSMHFHQHADIALLWSVVVLLSLSLQVFYLAALTNC